MKVKIIKCKGYRYWYKDHIGNEFTVKILNRWNYIVVEPKFESEHYILISDCEVLI